MPQLLQKLTALLFKPMNNSSLVLFRMAFGLLMAVHMVYMIACGQLHRNFIEPPFTFSFIGFEWLQPLPGQGMLVYAWVMAGLSVLVALGAWYRLSVILLALMWTALYLMQKADYNNHYYLMLILSWFMCIVPANRRLSVDVSRNTSLSSDVCPTWVYVLFMVQTGIMYGYAAISKLDPDWLSGRFLEIMFSRYRSHEYLAFLYNSHHFQLFIAYGGITFDALVVPLLCFTRTRYFALGAAIFFHLFNAYTFHIGIFPFLALSLCLFFFHDKLGRWIGGKPEAVADGKGKPLRFRAPFTILIMLYFFIQLALPLRHIMFPGDVLWTDEGYRLSWKMMLRTKSGQIRFKVVDPTTNQAWYDDPSQRLHKTHVMWLAGSPDMIWQYAQRLKKEFAQKGFTNVEVYALGQVSMNRRPYQPLVDSTIDLGKVKWEPFRHAYWISGISRK